MITLRNALLTLACVLLFTSAGEAKTLCVRPTGNDSSDGASWTTAKATPQGAMSVALAGDEIWVAAGTYTTHLVVKLGVALYGGFNGTETTREQRNWSANATILDGGGFGDILLMQQGYSPPQIIDGFTLTHGERAISAYRAAPTIRNNRITENRNSWGPGVWGMESRPRIIDNVIGSNYSIGDGAIAFADSEVYVAGNTLTGNTASGTVGGGSGGAMTFFRCPSVTIENNVVTDNVSAVSGGGIWIGSAGGQASVTGNVIRNNRGLNGTGGLDVLGVTAGLIMNNRVELNLGLHTGGIQVSQIDALVYHDKVLMDNRTETGGWVGGGGIYDTAHASIRRNSVRRNHCETNNGGLVVMQVQDLLLNENLIEGNTGAQIGGLGGVRCKKWALEGVKRPSSGEPPSVPHE